MKTAAYPLGQLAEIVEGELFGDRYLPITGVSNLDEAQTGHISYVTGPQALPQGEQSKASALIVNPESKTRIKPIIVTEDPRLAFSKVLALFAPERRLPVGVHPTAQVGNNLRMGRRVAIGAGAFVGDNVILGDDVVIHAQAYIGHEVTIGAGSEIHPQVYLGDRVILGRRVLIHPSVTIGSDGFGYLQTVQGHRKIPQIGTVIIEDDVEIGANSTIDRATVAATRIGHGTKIDDQVHVGHNVIIGSHCLLCGQTGISGSTTLGDWVVLAGQVGVNDHITICDQAVVGGKSSVWGNITQPGLYSGTPARPHKTACRIIATEKRLPEIMRRLKELERKAAKPEDEE